MKIWEIDLTETGATYLDQQNNKWTINSNGALIGEEGQYIELVLELSELFNMDFRKNIDWSRVPVDTKILVRDRGCNWVKLHFAKYENGKVYAWRDGKTSFTVRHNNEYWRWDCAKLYEENEE